MTLSEWVAIKAIQNVYSPMAPQRPDVWFVEL